MSEAQDLKLFISWSGKLSRGVALALRSWMPPIFDRVKPWASETDMEPGQRGLAEIEAELAGTKFGLVVVTQENQHAPWLNFEAGALSKVVPDDSEEARVVPLLVDMTTPTQVTGPIAQFQARVLNEQDIIDIAKSIGRVAGVDPNTAEDRCKAYWPKLDEKIKKVQAELDETPRQAPRPPNEMIEEILGLVRTIRSDMLASSARQQGIRDDTSIGVAKVLNHTLGECIFEH